jgi:hypothetical protein
MDYYPDQRIVSRLSTIHRECLLPENAIGIVRVNDGEKVDVRDIVANGQIPARHVIIPAAKMLGLRDKTAVERLLLVKMNQVVPSETPIAGKRKDRGKRVFAPVRGMVVAIDGGRIIMQEMPELVTVEAGVAGRVIQVYPNRGVAVEAVGAIVQGVWGNGRSIIATLRIEPEQDLRRMIEESLDIKYKGSVIVTTKSLKHDMIPLLEAGNINGVIAPSMPADLIEMATQTNVAVMLTQGFGTMRMTGQVYNLLKEYDGYQVTLDADFPGRWTSRRPEAVINRPIDERPPGLNLNATLKAGLRVRITREPKLGQIGRIEEIPAQLLELPNGLRVAGARVELISGETVNIPLANLELAGR